MRTFIATRPDSVRAALSCMEGGREVAIGACAGAVIVNAAIDQCAQVATRKATQNGVAVSVAPCHGGANQRWHLVAVGDTFELAAVSSGKCLEVAGGSQGEGASLQQWACTGIGSQRFSLRPAAQGTKLVAAHSGKCLALAPDSPQGAALIQVTCSEDRAQTWRVQRSIYQ
jgi:hypothetical protein